MRILINFRNVLSLRSAVTLCHIKLNTLTFIQRFITVTLDRTKMNEYVVSAFNFDKTKTFFQR